ARTKNRTTKSTRRNKNQFFCASCAFCGSFPLRSCSLIAPVSLGQISFGRPIVGHIFHVDRTEGALADSFFDGVSGQSDDARDDEERKAVLPGDAHIGNESGDYAVDVGVKL